MKCVLIRTLSNTEAFDGTFVLLWESCLSNISRMMQCEERFNKRVERIEPHEW